MIYAIIYALNAFLRIRRERRWVNRALKVYAREAGPVSRGRWP